MVDDWLKELKVGDKVVILGRNVKSITTVTRLTATRIICRSKAFMKSTGREVGASMWNANFLHEATPENISQIELQMKSRSLNHWFETFVLSGDFQKAPMQVREEIKRAIEALIPEKEEK